MNCEGCNKLVIGLFGVCLECVKARHKAVLKRKCVCGNQKKPTNIKRIGSRSWISCYRCLGQIKQLS